MDEQIESWQNQIRDVAPVMQTAEYELLKSEADVKRVLALWKTVALSEGIKRPYRRLDLYTTITLSLYP